MTRTFSITTIGCKLNQYESQWLRERFIERGWHERTEGERADVCIVNSCSVTARGDARCRTAARRARRAGPHALVVVTGCYAEAQPESLRRSGVADLVVGNRDKRSLPEIVETFAAGERTAPPFAQRPPDRDPGVRSFLDHARAFVAVQDGCDASCSYCIVPRARGGSRSASPSSVLAQVGNLREGGYREVVLVGVHIGRYGRDLAPRLELADLVALILERFDDVRVRLSSVEPAEMTRRLVDLAAGSERVAPHFHIPLQSGDDRVLASMNRPYGAERFREAIADVSRVGPATAIGTDIIVGFPGETEDRFERTAALVSDLPLTYFHVFAFSPRPGTPAATMDGQVPAGDKKRRSRLLIDLGAAKRRAFEDAQIGSGHLALVQGRAPGAGGMRRVLTGNYCEALVPGEDLPERSLVRIRVTGRERGKLRGTLLTSSASPGSHEGSER